jgi:hypothetical protein
MSYYLISYDLRAPGRDYQSLYDAIKRIANGWCHCLESVWIIGHAGPAAMIRDELKQHIDANDRLLVIKVTGDWASWNLSTEITEWLRQHLV